ncbi:MAG TPA: aldehyde dehydrogenase family protein [Acidimicrobiia bacterium]|jgi:acyl-CoA reductase-like NAD-dependent aldehyde dehydrogenase
MATLRALPIGAERVTTSETIAVRAPYDGRELAQVPACGPDEVDRAVAVAQLALRSDPLPAWRRAEILDTAARLLKERVDDFGRIIAEEAAKPLKTARIEANRAVSTFTFSAAAARDLTGEMIPMDASDAGVGKLGFTLRRPIGVVGAISPFNFPLNLVVHKVAPAIAAGCPVVLKPASQTPLSALALAELLLGECGLPPGHLNVVTGSGGSVGNALVEHEDVAMITFTGSPEVGWSIKSRAPRKKVGLELGNNAPVILEPDADIVTAATKIAVAGFSHAGQSCISTQRIYVHEDLGDAFLSELVPRVEALVVGDPLDDATDVSALISEGERDRVVSWIDEATTGGAKIATGGTVRDGVLEPTVLTDVTGDMKVCSLEVFGPVVAVQRYRTLDHALELANDTRYGLQAAIFTADFAAAMRAVHELDFGGVLVNEVPTYRSDQMPYGGLRDSGNTREGPRYAVEEMTEPRLVVLQLP